MRHVLSLLALVTAVALAPADDKKAKAVAVANAACACEDPPAPKKAKLSAIAVALAAADAECKCRSGGECACVQCKCVDAMAAREVLPAPTPVVTESARFIFVTSATCEPCQRMKAIELPRLRETIPVVESNGGYGATSFPTIIYEVNGKEKWRTTGYTSAGTLLNLRGS